jgi:hypothetical protein
MEWARSRGGGWEGSFTAKRGRTGCVERGNACKNLTYAVRSGGNWTLSILLACLFQGCATVPPLPPVNLKEPGWTVREGQAAWTREQGASELAGEILLATKGDRAFVQFSKTPFPMIVAQKTANTWEVQIPIQNKRYSGQGKPPARLIWLYLPQVLAGQPPPPGWSWKEDMTDWRLENRSTGEIIEGFLDQGDTAVTPLR